MQDPFITFYNCSAGQQYIYMYILQEKVPGTFAVAKRPYNYDYCRVPWNMTIVST